MNLFKTFLFVALYNLNAVATTMVVIRCAHDFARGDWNSLGNDLYYSFVGLFLTTIALTSFTELYMGRFVYYFLKWGPVKIADQPTWGKVVIFLVIPCIVAATYATIFSWTIALLAASVAPLLLAAIANAQPKIVAKQEAADKP